MPDYLSPRTAGRGAKVNSPVVASAGAASAGGLVGLDANGLIDSSMLPTSGSVTLPASEALAAGDYVNFWDNGGTVNARKADSASGFEADGFVKAAVASGASGEVFRAGLNDQQAGLTLGADQYLGAAGAVTETRTTTAGELDQYLGVAISATTIDSTIAQPVEL